MFKGCREQRPPAQRFRQELREETQTPQHLNLRRPRAMCREAAVWSTDSGEFCSLQTEEIPRKQPCPRPRLLGRDRGLLSMRAKSLHSCLVLCNPMDCNLPGSSVRGILQVRILEWVAIATQGSNQHLCVLHWQTGSLPSEPPEKAYYLLEFAQVHIH